MVPLALLHNGSFKISSSGKRKLFLVQMILTQLKNIQEPIKRPASALEHDKNNLMTSVSPFKYSYYI